ncbi:ATP-dependent DNA/RNA helicase DHX36 isoform X2 [Bombyx mori]|uniref:ATP-dependent DNA/RNA helicase DHX36 isoform X2 n=2 Tax=Bombyx mori TaxID=7091 RepID=UPI002ED0F892
MHKKHLIFHGIINIFFKMPRRYNSFDRFDRPRPPKSGLRGKEIGMYYKALSIEKGKKNKKNNVIRFKIPPSIVSSLYSNLASIEKLAKGLNICIKPIEKLTIAETPKGLKPELSLHEAMYMNTSTAENKNSVQASDNENLFEAKTPLTDFKKLEDISMISEDAELRSPSDVDNKSNGIPVFGSIQKEIDATAICSPDKKNKILETDNDVLMTPGPSKDFISVKDETVEIKLENRFLSLRSSVNYKYGYEDIITGTFDEKLDECLARGININIKNEVNNDLSFAMIEEYNDMLSKDGYKLHMKFRDKLPTYQKYEELLNMINNNQVLVISGETGCGKSTQVPQIILDDAIINKRGANVKILVTQPRRIAASSLAMRVAEERNEKLGNSVGYAVRLEKVDPRPLGSIMFCTTGILLTELEVNQSLSNYSHIILDEVHERDTHIDLSMCMLKKVLNKRKDLKLILMSATINAEHLTSYFGDCQRIHIEGIAYPVQDVYLEEILKMTGYKLPPAENKRADKRKTWQNHTKKAKAMAASEMEKDIQYKAEIGPWLETVKGKIGWDVCTTLLDARIEDINIDLIVEVLKLISSKEPGAVLVFLPGIGDITKLMSVMEQSCEFPKSKFDVYPLHSRLPSLEQHKIFQRPPTGIRKIIIATNIAETSITIDDIVYVIDCGKIKYSGLSIADNISTLKTEWISQANLRQRRGRAGRCQPGVCYHLVTSFRAGKLEPSLKPEMQRSDLLEPVLAIKRLRLGKAADALKDMAAPPAEETIKAAVKHLQQCGALNESEILTPLGWHLARLPVHPAAGKLLLLGALFGCLDRAASVAAVWGFKDPFQLVIGKEKQMDLAKKELALGEPSDHVAISEAIIQWEQCPRQHRNNFAYKNFLSMNTLKLLSEMKHQLADNLRQMGFLNTGNIKSAWENRNANNLSLFKAIVAAALYPNIGSVRWTNLHNRNPRKTPRIKVWTPEDGSIALHPSSVMANKHNGGLNAQPMCASPGANWLVYWLKRRSTDLFLFDVTLVYTLPLLFFGELHVSPAEDPDDCIISIEKISVCCKKETTQLLFEMRSLLDHVLADKIMASSEHSVKNNAFEEQVLNAVIKLITAEDEGAEYLNSDDDNSESDHSEYETSRRWYR